MTKILRFAVIAAMCLVGACLANAQYTQPSNPNYGNNKIGLCYSSTLNNWVGISNTPANTAAYSNQCDQYGNLVAFAQGQTVTTAAPGSVRGIVGSITTTNASYANGNSSITGVLGVATIPSGTTASTGYANGTQGKFILGGIVSGSIWATGLLGQLDISAATLTSASHVTPIWSDAGATGPAVSCTFCDSLVMTNTTATTFHSLLYGYSKAAYFADLTDNGGGYIVIGTGASAAVTGYLKVKVAGADAYIRVYAGAS